MECLTPLSQGSTLTLGMHREEAKQRPVRGYRSNSEGIVVVRTVVVES